MVKRYIIGVGLGVVILLIAAAAVVFYNLPYTFKGSTIQPPAPAENFSLQGAGGQTFSLAAQRGKVVLLFFGYTHCADACPATMSNFTQVKNKLGDQAQNVRFVFITVDPRRDTPDVTAKYAAGFDPSFIGLSGTESDLQPVWKAYGVYRNVPENPTSDNYSVDHSPFVYVIDSSGNLRETFSLGASPADMAQDVSALLKGR